MEEFSHLQGHRFPGGTVTVAPPLSWLWADALSAEQPESVHPSYAFALAMEGLGVSIEEILALVGTCPENGNLFGETEYEFYAPLLHGVTYKVEGEIVSVERKRGSRTGTFDRLRFAVTLSDASTGARVVRNINTWLIPRRGE